MNNVDVLLAVAAMAAVTFALRALPFIAAQWLQQHPFVHRLGRFLPLAIMTLLVLHAGVASARDNPDGPWPELVAVALTVALQWRLRHPLLSIACGLGAYVAWRNT